MISTEHVMPISMTEVEQQEIVTTLANLPPNSKFTEWGSGGSTILWYANLRSDQTLVSIENDPEWARPVRAAIELQTDVKQFNYYVYPTIQDGATFTPESDYYSDYVYSTDVWDSDLYLVDGRVRLWCARAIFEKARNRSAIVYCHDYAFNEGWYSPLLELYPRHEVIHTPDTPYKLLKLWMTP